MTHLAKMAAENVLALQGQDCRFVYKAGGTLAARCIAKPSLDQSSQDRFSSDQYDVSVLKEFKLSHGDQVELLDDDGAVELVITISKPFILLTAMRVFIGQVL